MSAVWVSALFVRSIQHKFSAVYKFVLFAIIFDIGCPTTFVRFADILPVFLLMLTVPIVAVAQKNNNIPTGTDIVQKFPDSDLHKFTR